MTVEQIMKLLPHRYPILLVDRVAEMDTEAQTIVGIKNVSINEPFFQGHFPGMPVMPGVLQLEAMAQTGGILLVTLLQTTDVIPYFMSIDKAKFRRVVKPGDQLHIEVQITTLKARLARMKATVKVGDEVASQAELMCMITPREAID
ncbi:MAG: 3-hydroxyacyl-ACP dehydratase FabZ [Verrucomicrobia bacterium]|nr:3-hydroxyacyl-ACP dehydratase FabZ [Verrucomicrobiota bacterium]MBT7069200.1 3-hydroxyacyl-ACP dehydratase FabZ [Verrucomicrobiota bacterium]MBT7700779.1 3-hydroxyacyl-ACP dehydratase FabZ [Verrucomicrobiota bacterium]